MLVGTKQNVYFGFAGFLVGGLLGLVIGLAINKRQTVFHYMQAIQCFRYSGIEVSYNMW